MIARTFVVLLLAVATAVFAGRIDVNLVWQRPIDIGWTFVLEPASQNSATFCQFNNTDTALSSPYRLCNDSEPLVLMPRYFRHHFSRRRQPARVVRHKALVDPMGPMPGWEDRCVRPRQEAYERYEWMDEQLWPDYCNATRHATWAASFTRRSATWWLDCTPSRVLGY